jgi:hypothetical protein
MPCHVKIFNIQGKKPNGHWQSFSESADGNAAGIYARIATLITSQVNLDEPNHRST